MKVYIALGLACLSVSTIAACNQDASEKHSASMVKPAIVKSLPNESNLAEIELTQKAFDRLGITTAKAEMQKVIEVRRLGGEVMIPPGESAVVVAPVSGTVVPPKDGSIPKPGSQVSRGQAIFNLRPLLTPERFVPTPAERAQIANAQASLISLQMTADGDVQQFVEQVSAARIALQRAEQLLRDRVGSERAVDDAKAQLALAEAGLKVARERKSVLDRLSSDIEVKTVSHITFDSPIGGIVRNIPVTVGQTVAAGNTLFEVVNLNMIWIRVPVYVGLLDELKSNEPAYVTFFGNDGKKSMFFANPVTAPPAADPLSSTVDLYYSLDNQNGRFRPGERVSVTLPMDTQSEALVVPASAILYDIHGSTWVYEKVSSLHFRRALVLVQRTTNDFAIINSGLSEGVEVVVNGTAELFGTEFGTGK
ncbi:efflux RND transporter periplasmic adaptor subunit [Calycomorphotria hydatis]|uniref:Solvent efflux pump periplasmic linker SrpA n=1 Tax=Calycomorphotria hydatis TaxID=2528027 RepID=A0A517TE29_9PLAN|nr:efflux RND transporter periplasmic adaptor subunit [Calycomorphotria hydatis]QDT66633.1 Solvent efflux pump periplasmic linker SrpA precursor [Calycomorphotria hydatis]